jgi:hypothetical protein
MTTDILDMIRQSCESVASQSQFVHIRLDKIEQYASSLPLEKIENPQHDAVAHYLDHGSDTVAFFVILDSINFGSGFFPFLQKRPGMSGYFTIASSLNDYFNQHGCFSSDALIRLTEFDCAQLFNQEIGNENAMQLMSLFAAALNALGMLLNERYHGSYTDLINSAEHSASHLVELLLQMPFFRDTHSYRGHSVSFMKRAQLLAADLALAFHRNDLGYFHDLHRLTIFADNLVPHVLRLDGILEYEPELTHRIDTEELILSGSEEEIEIRACALHSVELMVKALQHRSNDFTAMDLDYLLWNRGQQPSYKRTKPRHRSRTVFY